MINGLELNKFSELHGILVTLRSAELESPVICAFVSLSPSFYKLLAFSIFLSRTTGPSTELMGEDMIEVCSNKGEHPFPSGDNRNIVKLHHQFVKIFFRTTPGPILTKFSQTILGYIY